MSEWLNHAFSGGVTLARINPAGIVLMAAAVVLNVAARPISQRWPEKRRPQMFSFLKVAALVACCAGAALAIL